MISVRPVDLAIAALAAVAGIIGVGLVFVGFVLWLRGWGIK